jgi:hypothetical protein
MKFVPRPKLEEEAEEAIEGKRHTVTHDLPILTLLRSVVPQVLGDAGQRSQDGTLGEDADIYVVGAHGTRSSTLRPFFATARTGLLSKW